MTMVGKCCLCGETGCTGCKFMSELESWTLDFSPAMSYTNGLTATASGTALNVYGGADRTLTQTRLYPDIASFGTATPLTVPSIDEGGISGVSPGVGLVCTWGGVTGNNLLIDTSGITNISQITPTNKACAGIQPAELARQTHDGSWRHPYEQGQRDPFVAQPVHCGGSTGCGDLIYFCSFYDIGMHYLLTANPTDGESNKVDLQLEMWFNNLILELTDASDIVYRAFVIGGAISSSSWLPFIQEIGLGVLEGIVSTLYPDHPNPDYFNTIKEVSSPSRRSILHADFPDFQEHQIWSSTVDCSDLEEGSVEVELTDEVKGWYTGVPSLWTAIGITNIPQTITLTPVFA